jgi:hypothetical protein
MDMSELKSQWETLMQTANEYFSHLNDEEKYGWVAEGLGLALIVAGIVLILV